MKPIVFLFFCTLSLSGQTLLPGAKSKALLGQSVLITDNAGTVFMNPALLPELRRSTFWCNFFNPYQLKEVQSLAAAINYSHHDGGFALGFWQLGHKFYQEQLLSVGAGRRNLAGISVGVAIKFRRIEIQRYGAGGQVLLDTGFMLPVQRNITFGALIKNVYGSKLGRTGETLKREFISALQISSIAHTDFFIETVQVENYAPDLRFAATFSPLAQLQFLAGTGFNTSENFSAGFSLSWQYINIDYALKNHPYLALTHHFSLSLEFN